MSKELLADYICVLQCDGYGVYYKLAKKGEITLAGGLAHVRRKFVEAKDSDAKLAKHDWIFFVKFTYGTSKPFKQCKFHLSREL